MTEQDTVERYGIQGDIEEYPGLRDIPDRSAVDWLNRVFANTEGQRREFVNAFLNRYTFKRHVAVMPDGTETVSCVLPIPDTRNSIYTQELLDRETALIDYASLIPVDPIEGDKYPELMGSLMTQCQEYLRHFQIRIHQLKRELSC